MSHSDYRPRFSAEISDEQAMLLASILPHGMKKPLVNIIVEGILSIHEAGGQQALGSIISKYITIEQVVGLGLAKTKKEQIKLLEAKLKELKNNG